MTMILHYFFSAQFLHLFKMDNFNIMIMQLLINSMLIRT